MEKLICLRKQRLVSGSDRRYTVKQPRNSKELYLTIADGDFAFSKEISDAVCKTVESRNLAYAFLQHEKQNEIIKYFKKHHDITIKNDNILFGNGVLYWVQIAIQLLSKIDDGILIQPPVYESFQSIIEKLGRKVVNAPLKFKNNKFDIDWKSLEEGMKKSKLFILCSPHNPTGNVWRKEDIKRIVALSKKYNVYIISDEIWLDITFDEKFYSILNEDSNYLIHTSSPVKTFNLGGLQFGMAIVKNDDLRKKMRAYAEKIIHYSSSQPWITTAVKTTYGSETIFGWVDAYKKQIKKNLDILKKFFTKNDIEYSSSEGTYLLFVKLGNKKCKGAKLEKIMGEHHLHTGMGYKYGKEYEEWVRIDVAICDHSAEILLGHLNKIIKHLKLIKY